MEAVRDMEYVILCVLIWLLFPFVLQICDFGLAKWLPAKLTHYQVTTFEGTFGSVGLFICLITITPILIIVDKLTGLGSSLSNTNE